MKKVFLGTIFCLVVLATNAQKNNDSKIAFNLGGELGFATGNLSNVYSLGIGATAQLEYSYDDKLKIVANSGIIEYVGKKIPGTSTKFRSSAAIPVLGGVKYNFASNFYGTALFGVSIFSGVGGTSKFTYIPGLGFKANDKFDVLIKYTGYSKVGGAFGVRVSYAL